jgi:two-component system sensor histidine kinase ChiS
MDPLVAEAVENCRVLVVDDDAPLRNLLVSALRRHGCNDVESATNGAEAIERLQNGGPWAVLLLDLMMPTISGWEVIDWLAQHRELAPRSVIVASAADRAILHRLEPNVVNAIVFKPFDVFQLGAYVKAACTLPIADRRRRRVIAEAR